MYVIDGDREKGEGNRPYIGFERIKQRINGNNGSQEIVGSGIRN